MPWSNYTTSEVQGHDEKNIYGLIASITNDCTGYTLVMRFKCAYLTDIQFVIEYWFLYLIEFAIIVVYGLGKGMKSK